MNLIQKKQGGDLKGRICVNGSKQRKYLKEDESVSSPTAHFVSLLITLLIAAYERRDVAIYDVPGAYLQAKLAKKENNKRTSMKLEGEFVNITCDIKPNHEENVTYDTGRIVLYLEIV